MSSFSAATVEACIKLRDELYDTLKCHYCNKLIKSARTLNCSHHVCELCAIKQSDNEGLCKLCSCSYFNTDITNNVCITNIITVFHDLSANICQAANLMNIKISPIDQNKNEAETESESESEPFSQKQKKASQQRKRKLSNANQTEPNSKKRKINEHENENKNNEHVFIPSEICLTGFDKSTQSLFETYANSLGIKLNTKWKIGRTQMLISKYNAFDNTPNITFKVLASILCGIPVVKQSYLEDSYEQKKILDHENYICNYQRIDNSVGLFKGLNILFATTNMETKKLKTLLTLGKAKILTTTEEIDNKNVDDFETRIMICSHDIEWDQARQLSKKYNCKMISESWLIKSIYSDEINKGASLNYNYASESNNTNNYYDMEPIHERIDFDTFDKTIKSQDESSSNSDSED